MSDQPADNSVNVESAEVVNVQPVQEAPTSTPIAGSVSDHTSGGVPLKSD